ncbi:6-phosphogluconate dehydrogenase (decarboxylating) [Candidatus Pacearchaeota archaeon]|nr:6-phosphogluconate dehydrogenase (decarboxylating) [Candidatus Pacearchaeota archaeon]|tara:strand:- start:1938 stop:2834 length:897 start_codon:yes stop_codon:yes gene_type:complete
MKIGFIGLGRMGGNMVLNLIDHGHKVVVYNRTGSITRGFVRKGAVGSYSYSEMMGKLPKKKVVWMMVTASVVDKVIDDVLPLLNRGDVLIDGGNSYFKESVRRAKKVGKKGVHYLDVGTSGGVDGARHGACMMVGGNRKVFSEVEKLFRDMCVKDGYGYMGKRGSGHFVKMVHNGIEYGMMSAIGEGLEAVRKFSKGFGTDLKEVRKVYSHGSIIEGRLMGWADKGMGRSYYRRISGKVPRGETEGEMEELVKMADMPVLKTAVRERKKTRKKASEFGKIVSVMRNEFGGHGFSGKGK